MGRITVGRSSVCMNLPRSWAVPMEMLLPGTVKPCSEQSWLLSGLTDADKPRSSSTPRALNQTLWLNSWLKRRKATFQPSRGKPDISSANCFVSRPYIGRHEVVGQDSIRPPWGAVMHHGAPDPGPSLLYLCMSHGGHHQSPTGRPDAYRSPLGSQ